ncbi:MAG: hypothetical protein LBH05_07990 [Deferribacteraceae bacterium]|nr:hypothetical protein [Deferribacteraceae bacterium]
MVIFLFLIFPEEGVSGCSGPCYSCHPQLQGKADHLSLGTCALCHNGKSKKLSVIPKTNINGGCGERCFLCHNEWPKNAYHAELDKCLSCHKA